MKRNALKLYAWSHGVNLYDVGRELRLSDSTLARRLRGPVSAEFEGEFMAAVDRLAGVVELKEAEQNG